VKTCNFVAAVGIFTFMLIRCTHHVNMQLAVNFNYFFSYFLYYKLNNIMRWFASTQAILLQLLGQIVKQICSNMINAANKSLKRKMYIEKKQIDESDDLSFHIRNFSFRALYTVCRSCTRIKSISLAYTSYTR
jgi:hypothetical protein